MTGETIKALRQHLGLTQKEFALSIGNLPDQVCRWEKGKTKISKAYQSLIEAKYFVELKCLNL